MAKKLVNESRNSHAQRENSGEQTRAIARAGFPEQQHQDDQQRQPFEPCLIKLAGMAWQIARAGEHHRPWHAGNAAPQLAIDEIGEPPQQHPHRHADADVIDHPDEVQFVAPCDERHRHRHPGQAAVERHSAVPQPQQFPADKPIARKIGEGARDAGFAAGIKRCVAEPPADNHAQRAIEEQVIGMALRHRRARLLQHLRGVPIGENHPDQIGQRIVPQGKEPQFDPRLQPQIGPVDRIGSDACGK